MALASSWLEGMTGKSTAWWMAACQRAVKRTSSPSSDPNHDSSDPLAFLKGILILVVASLPPEGSGEPPYDPNMRAAAIASVVLALWYGRLGFAKIHDPARPVSLRVKAHAKWLAWARALHDIVLDEGEDATYFPGQGWDFPFAVGAKDGGFV